MNRVRIKLLGNEKEFYAGPGCTVLFFLLWGVFMSVSIGVVLALIYLMVAAAQWLLAAV